MHWWRQRGEHANIDRSVEQLPGRSFRLGLARAFLCGEDAVLLDGFRGENRGFDVALARRLRGVRALDSCLRRKCQLSGGLSGTKHFSRRWRWARMHKAGAIASAV